MILPAGEFFTPLPAFWEAMGPILAQVNVFECGSGSGLVLEEAAKRGYQIRGCDLMDRDEQSPRVERLNALELHWDRTRWPLICRPDHSNWCWQVVARAIRQDASALYVGLTRNYWTHLEGFRTRRIAQNVGRQGEHLYLIPALKGKA